MTYQKSLNIYNRFCSVSLLYGETKYTSHAPYNTTNKKQKQNILISTD